MYDLGASAVKPHDLSILPTGSQPAALEFPHFPTRWQAFLWRNCRYFPHAKLAEVLECSIDTVRLALQELGLPEDLHHNPNWLKIGYLSIIRDNWHLLDYEQLLQLLDWTPEKLNHTLCEEDFLWSKMGRLKPLCGRLAYKPLTREQRLATVLLRIRLHKHVAKQDMDYVEQPFTFAAHYRPPKDSAGKGKFKLNFIHSYAASCGDLFYDIENYDPIPEDLLRQYASHGIKGIWVHALLYLLHPIEGAEEYSAGYEQRLVNLEKLTGRCAGYGIKIFLYLNEPRGMPAQFYLKHPEWEGIDIPTRKTKTTCTSFEKPLKWLEEACYAVFNRIPELAGVFLINMSENPTHCNYAFNKHQCPRCAFRDGADIIAEIITAVESGIHRAAPEAMVIANDWAWRANRNDKVFLDFKKKVIDRLPENVCLLSVSEWNMKTDIGGVKHYVMDYSISQVGPSEEVTAAWDYARKRGLKVMAKIQMNNSWELSAVPFIPVPYLMQEHLEKLSRCGIKDLMLGWTLGGYPGGYLELLNKNVEEIAAEYFSPENSREVCSAWKMFSEAFRNFPFGIFVIYQAPMNYGPMNLLHLKPTNYKATMIGFPYDDLTGWRSVYPEDVFEEQFRKLTEGWKSGLDILESIGDELTVSEREAWQEQYSMALTSYCHFRSTYLQIRFVRARNAGDCENMRLAIAEELELAHKLYDLIRRDSRIGFEASNHYYYNLNSLLEKIINCEYILTVLNNHKQMVPRKILEPLI